MLRARFTRKIGLWLATLGLLAGCVAPLVSQLLAQAPTSASALSSAQTSVQASAWQLALAEVCTALGAESRRVGDGGPADAPVPAPMPHAAFEHCPYCALHLPSLGPPPAPLLALAPGLSAPAVPPARQAAPPDARGWVWAPPRAPPSAC